MPSTGSITPDRIAEQFADDLPTICFAAWVGEKSDADLRQLPPMDAANIAAALAELADRYQDVPMGSPMRRRGCGRQRIEGLGGYHLIRPSPLPGRPLPVQGGTYACGRLDSHAHGPAPG